MSDATDGPDPSAPAPTDGGDQPQNGPSGGPTGPAGASSPTLRNLPEKPIAALYNALSTDWGDPWTPICNDLTIKQYQGASAVVPMTVDALKTLPQGVGVLVMFAHGVFFSDNVHQSIFCIATSQLANPADDLLFKDDLHPPDGSMPTLVTFDVAVSPPGAPVPSTATTTNYCITPAFVDTYWKAKFCQDSLAIMCTCNLLDSTSQAATKFAQVLQESAGVGYLLGWTDLAVTTDMSSAAIFLVDRLSGGNDPAAKPEPPPQRPFDIATVLDDITNYQNGEGGPLNTSQGTAAGVLLPVVAQLVASASDTNRFGILAPSIFNLEMMAVQTELAIAGWFGDDPGSQRGVVKINDTQVDYKSWSPNEIVCPLLVGDETGPVSGQAAGMVVVEVDGRPSNSVPLTEWRGKLVFTVKGEGSLQVVCTWTYHLKADVHHFRIKPGPDADDFLDVPVGVFTLRDSSLTYQASGKRTLPGSDPPQTESWSGSGTLKPAVDMSDPRETYVLAGQIVRPTPPELHGSYMLLGVVGGDGATWTYDVTTTSSSGSSTSPAAAFADWSELSSSSPGPPFEGLMLKLPLDDQMGITAATYPFTVGEHSCTLSIQPEPPNYPPDPKKGEDQSVLNFGLP